MELNDLKRHWDSLGRIDPLWAVLTDPRFKNNKWEVAEFFRTGEGWIDELVARLEGLGIHPAGGRCLDFGCGVGRLSQALCKHFASCDGVDIAPSMIDLARRHNRYGDRCRYQVNEADDLGLFPQCSFDFVCSLLVLQHMEPRYAKRYVAEFIRVLKPGAIAAFQLPSVYLGVASALSDSGYRASITPSCLRLSSVAGQALAIEVRIRNESDVVWRNPVNPGAADFGRLRLGNHWLDREGNMLMLNDGRADLPPELGPQQEVMLQLTVNAPEVAGLYLLELDLVEEGVTWFAQRGVATARIELSSRTARRGLAGLGRAMLRFLPSQRRHGAPDSDEEENPFTETHCVPREEIRHIVEAAGGKVLHMLENDWCGGGFDSVLYVATRTVAG